MSSELLLFDLFCFAFWLLFCFCFEMNETIFFISKSDGAKLYNDQY